MHFVFIRIVATAILILLLYVCPLVMANERTGYYLGLQITFPYILTHTHTNTQTYTHTQTQTHTHTHTYTFENVLT